MKITAVFVFVLSMSIYANSYGQSEKVNLVKNSTLREVIEELEQVSGYHFVLKYDTEILDKKVNANYQNEKIEYILDDLLKDTGFNYKIIDRYIAISRDENVSFQASEIKVSGKVTDKSGAPLPGVTVVVKGTTNGTITNFEGVYTLSDVPSDGIIQFSFVGMKMQEIPVAGKTSINIVMEEDAIGLEEVIAIGYGTMKKSDLTGAISSVSGSDMSDTKSPNLLEQAQGRLAGVDIVKNSGSPGSAATIRIRGNRSINAGNGPLFVIDGIPTGQSINDFSPNDIESVEVLKDASAVAIYGSRGANGVILISTKRGKKGNAVIESNNYYGIKAPIENIDLMNAQEFVQYARIAHSIAQNDNSQDDMILGQPMNLNYKNGVDTDWLDLVLRNGVQHEHQLSVRGGSDAMTYYLSGNYYKEEGVMEKADYERFSLRANVDGKLSDKINVGLSLSASKDIRNQIPTEDVFFNAVSFVPIAEAYDQEGNIISSPNPLHTYLLSPLLPFAPNQHVDETKGYRFFSNLFGDYQFTKELSFRVNFGIDYQSTRRGQSHGDYNKLDALPTASIANNNKFAYTLENILTFDKKIGEHNFNLVGLFSVQKQSEEGSYLSGRSIPITRSSFYDLGSAEEITGINSKLVEWGLLSYMGRLNYRLKGKYLFTVSGRADGSSRLAEGHKWAFFPAASAAWIISEENFFNIDELSFLKIRAGYGKVGNTAIQPYQTLGGLNRTEYAFGDTGAFGFGLSGIANPFLGWEVSKTTNFGLDFGFLDNRISGSFEYYITNTNDLLLRRQLPITSGFQSVLENVGSTKNEGWELSLSFNILNRPSGFKWDIDANLYSNKEEITELFNGTSDDVGNEWFIGQPINVFYDHKFDGIWQTDEAEAAAQVNQSPGDIKIADVNGRDELGNYTKLPDGTINSDDRTILGSTVPDWSGGLTNRISYKGFKFSMLVYARQGQMIESRLHDLSGNRWEGRTSAMNFNYWTPDNPSNEVPIPRKGQAPLYSSAVKYKDGSFVKIKDITIGYDLSRELIKIRGLQSMQVYLSAINPVIFSNYDFIDPESANGVVGNDIPTATYMIGLNLKF